MQETRKCGFIIESSQIEKFKKLANQANFNYELAKYGINLFTATITTTTERFIEVEKIQKELKKRPLKKV